MVDDLEVNVFELVPNPSVEHSLPRISSLVPRLLVEHKKVPSYLK